MDSSLRSQPLINNLCLYSFRGRDMEVGMPQVVMTQQFYSRNEHRSLGGKTNVSSAKGIAVIGAVLCLSSCWIRPIPPHFEPGPHRAPPTSVDNVRVVNLSGENWAEQLPEGLYAGNSNQYIMAADDYPTRETPHGSGTASDHGSRRHLLNSRGVASREMLPESRQAVALVNGA